MGLDMDGNNLNFKERRQKIKDRFGSRDGVIEVLTIIGIDINRNGMIRVRESDKTPSAQINTDGSVYDHGSSERYSDIVSLLFDGYRAFNSMGDTLEWLEAKI